MCMFDECATPQRYRRQRRKRVQSVFNMDSLAAFTGK